MTLISDGLMVPDGLMVYDSMMVSDGMGVPDGLMVTDGLVCVSGWIGFVRERRRWVVYGYLRVVSLPFQSTPSTEIQTTGRNQTSSSPKGIHIARFRSIYIALFMNLFYISFTYLYIQIYVNP